MFWFRTPKFSLTVLEYNVYFWAYLPPNSMWMFFMYGPLDLEGAHH